jgi:hypothetical protein
VTIGRWIEAELVKPQRSKANESHEDMGSWRAVFTFTTTHEGAAIYIDPLYGIATEESLHLRHCVYELY